MSDLLDSKVGRFVPYRNAISVINQILGYLDLDNLKIASTVCKSWLAALSDLHIFKNIVVTLKEENFPKICKSNRRFGKLRLHFLKFDKEDSYYFELFEKLCPFINELHMDHSQITLDNFLKLLELTTPHLKYISLSENWEFDFVPGLFPSEYSCEAKNQIVANLSGVKTIVIEYLINIPLIVDLVRCTKNLDTFSFCTNTVFPEDEVISVNYFFTIFDNFDCGNLTHLFLDLYLCCINGCVNDFITNFIKIKNLQLKSFHIGMEEWSWDQCYNSSLFKKFIMKLKSLEEFNINGFRYQLSTVCQHLVDLKSLDFELGKYPAVSELQNLKNLEKLHCRQIWNSQVNVIEIDKFFKCKFEFLQILKFEEFVTESNLQQLCENHGNLIELELPRLRTPNLEPIFKYLTKLQILNISFCFAAGNLTEIFRPYDYKVTRLQHLETFYLSKLVNGVTVTELKKLKKLRFSNLF